MSAELNFTPLISLSRDGQWGGLEADNVTWNGMIGMLMDESTDIVTAALSHTSRRDIVIDFSTPIIQV